MKALSVKQPWASRIASGRKTVETRVWGTDYRGDLLIVSSKRPDNQGPAGMALAIVELYDCRLMRDAADWNAARCTWYPGAYGLFLRRLRVIEMFPVVGSLKLYDVQEPLGGFKVLVEAGIRH